VYNGVVWDKRQKSSSLIIIAALLMLVILSAAILLCRWIDRVRDADRLREKELLEVAFHGLQAEFSTAFQEIFLTYRPLGGTPDEAAIKSHRIEMSIQWQNNARHPQLVKTLSLGLIGSKNSPSYHRFQADEKIFKPLK